MFCYAQCNNGALLYELFCCIKSIKKTFDEQRVLPSFSCNVEAVLRNEEIYEADLWYKELSGDIEWFELLGVAPAIKRSIAVADCLSHFNDGQQITVLTKLVFHVFSKAGSFLFGQPRHSDRWHANCNVLTVPDTSDPVRGRPPGEAPGQSNRRLYRRCGLCTGEFSCPYLCTGLNRFAEGAKQLLCWYGRSGRTDLSRPSQGICDGWIRNISCFQSCG